MIAARAQATDTPTVTPPIEFGGSKISTIPGPTSLPQLLIPSLSRIVLLVWVLIARPCRVFAGICAAPSESEQLRTKI